MSAGSIIPADLRIIESKDLYVGQASLTGESDNIKKTVELENKQEELDSISDLIISVLWVQMLYLVQQKVL